MLEDMQITNGTLALRARGGSPRDLSVGVVGERAPVPCAPAAPGNRDLRRPPPRQAEPRGPHSESSALKLVPTRAMVWTGSARPSIAVTTNMAKNHCQEVDLRESLWYRVSRPRRAWGGKSTVSSSEVIDVQVRQGILWVGSEAYPLRNIARVQPAKLVPNRGAALRSYLKAVVFCVFLIVAAAVAARVASQASSAQTYNALHGVADGAFALAAVLAVISTIWLITRLSRRTAYALIIETAGTPRTALVTYDEDRVFYLVRRITDAISNPKDQWPAPVPVQVINNKNIYNVDARGSQGAQIGGHGNISQGNRY